MGEPMILIGPLMGVGTVFAIWYLDRLLPVEIREQEEETQIVVKTEDVR
jgi:hypothetical protein